LREIALNNKQSEFYDKDEAKRRFEAALRGARVAGHKPMTDVPKKRPSQAKRKQYSDYFVRQYLDGSSLRPR